MAENADPNQDKILKDSFPASDPSANSGTAGAGKPDKPPQRDADQMPTGAPTSDRFETETAHHDVDAVHPSKKDG
jgi:hypothetical protein